MSNFVTATKEDAIKDGVKVGSIEMSIISLKEIVRNRDRKEGLFSALFEKAFYRQLEEITHIEDDDEKCIDIVNDVIVLAEIWSECEKDNILYEADLVYEALQSAKELVDSYESETSTQLETIEACKAFGECCKAVGADYCEGGLDTYKYPYALVDCLYEISGHYMLNDKAWSDYVDYVSRIKR